MPKVKSAIPSANTVERSIAEMALCLGRNLMAEVKRALAYKASRQDADGYTKFLAGYFAHHEALMIDRRLWNRASLTMNDKCNLQLQFIEHFTCLAPHSIICYSKRKQTIDKLNTALSEYCNTSETLLDEHQSESGQTYLTDTLAKAKCDSINIMMEKMLQEIKSELLTDFNFSILEDGLLMESDHEELVNAIYFENNLLYKTLVQSPADKIYWTQMVPEDEEENETGNATFLYFNITYPRYIPVRNLRDGKTHTYADMDLLNKSISERLLQTLIRPVRVMLSFGLTERRLVKLPFAVACVEIFCAALLDLFSRNVISNTTFRRYKDNIDLYMFGLNSDDFTPPASYTVVNDQASLQADLCADMCFLMPLSSYGFAELGGASKAKLLEGHILSSWDPDNVLSHAQYVKKYPNNPIKTLADLPSTVYAVPLQSCYGLHESYLGDFKQMMQGVSRRLALKQVDHNRCLDLVSATQEPRLGVPDILDSFLYQYYRQYDDEAKYVRPIQTFPSFLMSDAQKVLASAEAKWEYFVRSAMPIKCFEILADPNAGWGTCLKMFEDSLQSRYADQFMDRFFVLLDKLIELFAGNKELFDNFSLCKSLIGSAKASHRLRLVGGFSKAMRTSAPVVSRYCSLLNVFRAVDSKVRAAVMAHNANHELAFQEKLKSLAMNTANSSSSTSSSPEPVVKDAFDSETVIVFEWDDMTVSDPPSDIVRDRNQVRAGTSLASIAKTIDQNLSQNEMLAKTGLKLNLLKSLQILAEREMMTEDASTSEMSLLHDLYDVWSKIHGPQPSEEEAIQSYMEQWMGDILYIGPLDKINNPLHPLAWFGLEPYMRHLLVDSWYIARESDELSIGLAKAKHKDIMMAPMSERRRPLLLDPNGTLSIVLDLINSLCVHAVQFTKTYLDEAFSRCVQDIYNSHKNLQIRQNDLVFMTMPQVIHTDANGTSVEQWSDVLHLGDGDDDDLAANPNADSLKSAMSFMTEVAMALLSSYTRINNTMDVFAKKDGITKTSIFFRCLRIISDLLFCNVPSRMVSNILLEKHRIFDAWCAYRHGVDSLRDQPGVSFSQALDAVRVLEFQRFMLPPHLTRYMTSYLGGYAVQLAGSLQDLSKVTDTRLVNTVLQTILLPFMKLTGNGSDQVTDIKTIQRIKSNLLDGAAAKGQSVPQLVSSFLDTLDEAELGNPDDAQ